MVEPSANEHPEPVVLDGVERRVLTAFVDRLTASSTVGPAVSAALAALMAETESIPGRAEVLAAVSRAIEEGDVPAQ